MYQSRIRDSKHRGGKSRARTLIEPDDEQDYGIVQDMLGNGRLRALCSDAKVRVGRIRGSMRKYAGKVIIDRGDLIIVARRDYEDDKVDVVHKYTHEETAKLMKNGMLPVNIIKEIQKTDMTSGGASHDYIVFMDEEEACGGDPSAADDIDIDDI
jgi:translation initiation factor 1A